MNKILKFKNIKFIITIILLYTTNLVFAQKDTIALNEILIIDSNTKNTIGTKVINNSLSIDRPHDAGELFENMSGFSVIKRGAYAIEPIMRSFKYEQINLQYDGGMQIVNSCPNRMDPITTHVTPEEIEKIEIIKGPYSVRFGQTMGGIINMVTRNVKASDNFSFSGEAEGGYEINGNGKFSRLSLSAGKKKVNLLVNGGFKDFENYTDGDGNKIASEFSTYDYSAKLSFMPNKNNKLQITWRQSFARDILHAGLPMDADIDNSSVATIDYSIKNITDNIFSLKMKIYGSDVYHEMSNKRRPNFMMTDALSIVESNTFGGKLEIAYLPFGNWNFYTGIDNKYISRDGDRTRLVKKNPCTGMKMPEPKKFNDLIWQNSYINILGFYTEMRNKISDNFSFISGVRVDYVVSGIKEPATDFEKFYTSLETQDETNYSVNASLNYKFTDNWTLQFAIGRGNRSASLIERYVNHFTIGKDAHEYVGNPNLNPEINNQTDIILIANLGIVQFDVDIFYSYITDYITGVVNENISRKYMPCMEPAFAKQFTNIDEVSQTGFETNAKFKVTKKININLWASYTYAKNISMSEPLAEIPPFMSGIHISYTSKKIKTGVKAKYSAKQDRTSDSFSETETPDYQLLDFYLSYRPFKMLEFSFTVNNILDAHYYDHMSRAYKNMSEKSMFYEIGRNFGLSAKINF